MKKRVSLVLLLIFALVLCGCGEQANTPTEPSVDDPVVQTPEQNDPEPPVNPPFPGTVITGYDADWLTYDAESGILYFQDPRFLGSYFKTYPAEGTVRWSSDDKTQILFTYIESRPDIEAFSMDTPVCFEVDLVRKEAGFRLDLLDSGKVLPALPEEYMLPMGEKMAEILFAIEPEGTLDPGVCPNPEIANLIDTINAALGEGGHPIVLEHPSTPSHRGKLKIVFTGEGANPYKKHLSVSLYETKQDLGQDYEDGFSCHAKYDPTPEARDAARIIFQTAITVYDSALNEKYANAFVSLADGIMLDEYRNNIYGVSASMMYDVVDEFAQIRTEHEIRGLQLWHWENVTEENRSVSYQMRRLETFRPAMPLVYRQGMLNMLGEVYTVKGPLNIETDTEDWIGEYSDAVISHPEYGEIDMGFNSRMADEAIRVTSVRYDTAADKEKLDWLLDVCSRMLAFCGDQFDAEEQKEIIAAVQNLKDGEEQNFVSESSSMQVQLRRDGNYYVFIIRMKAGGDLLTEEELAEINTWFAWNGEPGSYPVGNSFLTCVYTRPGKMNLFEVFGGQGGTDNENGQISDSERNALAKVQEHYASGYEVQKFKRSSMDKLLKQYTGYKLADLQWSGLDAFVYLDNYDAYYTVYGGTNKGSYTMVEGWENLDGTLSLVYKNDRTVYETGYEYCIVTLKPAESGKGFHGYWFVSNLPYIN